jgi:hypothetical protein
VTYYIDPKIAIGYDYRTGTGNPQFAAVTPPSGIGGGKFELFCIPTSSNSPTPVGHPLVRKLNDEPPVVTIPVSVQ